VLVCYSKVERWGGVGAVDQDGAQPAVAKMLEHILLSISLVPLPVTHSVAIADEILPR